MPDWKRSVSVICVRMYLYVPGTYWYVLPVLETMLTDISLTLDNGYVGRVYGGSQALEYWPTQQSGVQSG